MPPLNPTLKLAGFHYRLDSGTGLEAPQPRNPTLKLAFTPVWIRALG
jgi:hypothetical protein